MKLDGLITFKYWIHKPILYFSVFPTFNNFKRKTKVYFQILVCDPVMGDNGKMYVPEEILPVYRDVVVPLADILTPNQFEAELITGLQMKDLSGAIKVIQALHEKGVQTVVLSSTDLGDEKNMIGIASNKGEFITACY